MNTIEKKIRAEIVTLRYAELVSMDGPKLGAVQDLYRALGVANSGATFTFTSEQLDVAGDELVCAIVHAEEVFELRDRKKVEVKIGQERSIGVQRASVIVRVLGMWSGATFKSARRKTGPRGSQKPVHSYTHIPNHWWKLVVPDTMPMFD